MYKAKMIFTGLLSMILLLVPTHYNQLAARGGGHGGGDFGGGDRGYGGYGDRGYGDYQGRGLEEQRLYNELNDYSGYDSGYSSPSYYPQTSPYYNPYTQTPNMNYSPNLDDMPINPPSPSNPTGQ